MSSKCPACGLSIADPEEASPASVEAVELQPCPFCGKPTVATVYIRDGRRVACNCGAAGPCAFNGKDHEPSADERARAAWNRRAIAALPARADVGVEQAAKDIALWWAADCMEQKHNPLSLNAIERLQERIVAALARPASSHVMVDSERDWPEDFSQENGNYSCTCHKCGEEFIGYKRRVICKLCSALVPADTVLVERKVLEPFLEAAAQITDWGDTWAMSDAPNRKTVRISHLRALATAVLESDKARNTPV